MCDKEQQRNHHQSALLVIDIYVYICIYIYE